MNDFILKRVPLDASATPGRLELLDDAGDSVSRQALDWPGLMVEAGKNQIAEVERVTLAHHYVGVNDGVETQRFRGFDDGDGRRDVVLQPGDMWIAPAGTPITLRAGERNRYLRLTIDPKRVAPVELRAVHGIRSPQLHHLMLALLAESDGGNPGGLVFVDAMAAAVAGLVALHAGTQRPLRETYRGGLASGARRRVLELMHSEFGGSLSVDALAREAGLSPGHFAHAFKETFGVPPHRYLVTIRLERARHMLGEPEARLSDVAQRAGFSDQAHFTRLFKRQFGVTPGSARRSR